MINTDGLRYIKGTFSHVNCLKRFDIAVPILHRKIALPMGAFFVAAVVILNWLIFKTLLNQLFTRE